MTAYPGSSACSAQPFILECNLNCINEMWRPCLAESGAQDAITLSVVDFPASPDLDHTKGIS